MNGVTLSGLDAPDLRSLQEIVGKTITAHWTIRNIFDLVAKQADGETDWTPERQAVYQHLPDAWMGLRQLVKYMPPQEQDVVLRAASVLMADVDYHECAQETLAGETARQAERGRLYRALMGKKELVSRVRERLGTLRRYALTKCVEAESQILDALLALEKRIETSRTSSPAADVNGRARNGGGQEAGAGMVLTLDGPNIDAGRVAYSVDCRSVRWYGTLFTFTPVQAACVKVLIEHYKHGVPEVGEKTILTNEWVETSQQRLASVFNNGNHKAWGTMIKRGSTKGSYRLAKPDEKKQAPTGKHTATPTGTPKPTF